MKKSIKGGLLLMSLAGLAAGTVFAASSNKANAVKADASHGVAYGFVDFAYNPVIESSFPSGWGWADVDHTFTDGAMTWKVSSGRRSSLNDKFYIGYTEDAAGAEARSLLSLKDSDDDYAGMVSATGQSSGYGFAIQTADYVEHINDLHLSFSAEAGFLYVLYHRPSDADGVWNIIKSSSGENAFACTSTTYVGSHGVWNAGYDSFNWTFKYILGDNEEGAPRAKIAFVYWTYNYAVNLILNYVSINTDQAAMGYMNSLADVTWCSDKEHPTLNKTTLGIYTNLLSEAQNTTLRNTSITGDLSTKTGYTDYYSLFSYICDINDVSIANPINTSSLPYIIGKNNELIVILATLLGAGIFAGLYFVLRRKKVK